MSPNRGQFEAWNGGESVHYVSHADRYDRQLSNFTTALFDQAAISADDTVLDIGCGCGVTTLRAAANAQRVLGLDISHPLVEIARQRAADAGVDNAEFVVADAQTHGFADDEFSVVISQFGLMFFDDPEGALANLRHSLAPGGRLLFICWQGLEFNEWLMVAGRAVAKYCELPDLGGRSGGPGMFSLKRPEETIALLEAAEFTRVAVEPITTTVLLAGGDTVDASLDFLLGMGMVRGLINRLDEDVREQAIEQIKATLTERYETNVGVTLGAAGYLVSAHR